MLLGSAGMHSRSLEGNLKGIGPTRVQSKTPCPVRKHFFANVSCFAVHLFAVVLLAEDSINFASQAAMP